jgi:hypothetical protein
VPRACKLICSRFIDTYDLGLNLVGPRCSFSSLCGSLHVVIDTSKLILHRWVYQLGLYVAKIREWRPAYERIVQEELSEQPTWVCLLEFLEVSICCSRRQIILQSAHTTPGHSPIRSPNCPTPRMWLAIHSSFSSRLLFSPLPVSFVYFLHESYFCSRSHVGDVYPGLDLLRTVGSLAADLALDSQSKRSRVFLAHFWSFLGCYNVNGAQSRINTAWCYMGSQDSLHKNE